MSNVVRASVWVLAVLVAISAGVAVFTLMQKQTLQGQNQNLHNQISDDESKIEDLTAKTKKLQDDEDQLNNKISQAQQDKAQLQNTYDDLKQKSEDLQTQLTQANSDRDDWKNRVETINRERDELMEKLRNRPARIIYRTRIVRAPAPVYNNPQVSMPTPMVDVTSSQGDQYWASVLKDKAALQVELERDKYQLDQAALQVADLKKQNSDLDLELKEVNNEKDEIVQKIKYGQDLADNLSIDLARARNDQKAVNDRADRLKEQNLELLYQVKELTSAKVSLEQTVSRLTDDKDAMQKKLIETESVIQSRIDDIWKIKESLDKKLSENEATPPSDGGGMELPPIIVNAPNNQQQAPPQAGQVTSQETVTTGKTEGSIISINETNNFVIVDLGQENSSVNVGTLLKVYRNSNAIANLEVIQVRRDICAADIKDTSTALKVGDVVKFN